MAVPEATLCCPLVPTYLRCKLISCGQPPPGVEYKEGLQALGVLARARDRAPIDIDRAGEVDLETERALFAIFLGGIEKTWCVKSEILNEIPSGF